MQTQAKIPQPQVMGAALSAAADDAVPRDLAALVDLSPTDEAAIEGTTLQLWKEAATQPDAFEQRSGRSLQRVGKKLVAWSEGGAHAKTMTRLRGELDTLCAGAGRSDADRAACKALLTPPAKAST